MLMESDPSVQTPEQREQELRAAGWRDDYVVRYLTWCAPDGRPFAHNYGAWCVMRAERGEQTADRG